MMSGQEQERLKRQQERIERGIREAMERIEHRIVVFSGKGGVGKTTVAVNLACALAKQGQHIGLLDADVTGPNVPLMIGIDEPPRTDGDRLLPHERFGLRVVSLASMLPAGAAVIWRGPMRSKALDQLLGETEWGDLGVLIVDLPPGTGDEVLTIVQRTSPQMAIVVTTPQEVALLDARRAISFARKLEVPSIGIVENMSGLICPHCGGVIDLFGTGGGEREAAAQGVEFLGSVPIDPAVREGGDAGRPVVLSDPAGSASRAFLEIASGIADRVASEGATGTET